MLQLRIALNFKEQCIRSETQLRELLLPVDENKTQHKINSNESNNKSYDSEVTKVETEQIRNDVNVQSQVCISILVLF